MQCSAENLIQDSVEDIPFTQMVLRTAYRLQAVFFNLENTVLAAQIYVVLGFLHLRIVAILSKFFDFIGICDVWNVKNRDFSLSCQKSVQIFVDKESVVCDFEVFNSVAE